MHVVLLAHGSRDPRHAATIERIAAALNARSLRSSVGAAYLDLCAPDLATAVADLPRGESVVVVPLLLTSAFHAAVDVPTALAEARDARPDLQVRVSDVLGPSSALTAAMDDRLREAGVDPADGSTATLLVAAGSSDAAARAEVATLTDHWLGPDRRGTHAFAAGEGSGVEEAVRSLVVAGARRVAVAPYLLAPGVLPDRAFAAAAAIAADLGVQLTVAAVLGDHEQVQMLIAKRARGAGS